MLVRGYKCVTCNNAQQGKISSFVLESGSNNPLGEVAMNPLYDTFLVEQDIRRTIYTTEDQDTLTPSHHYMDRTVERA